MQACSCQDDGIELSLLEFSQSRIQIAAQHRDLQVWSGLQQLSLASKTRSPDGGSKWKIPKRAPFPTDERISDILTLRNTENVEPIGQLRRNILHAVNGEINLTGEQRVLNFFDEQAFPPIFANGTSTILSPDV